MHIHGVKEVLTFTDDFSLLASLIYAFNYCKMILVEFCICYYIYV